MTSQLRLHLEDPDDDSGDSEEETAPTTARLISVEDPSSHISWPRVHPDPEEDEEEELWGANTGREAVGSDERALPRVPSITVMSSASASFFERGPMSPSPPVPPLPNALVNNTATHPTSPTEEWRAKILESVRKGEEKVAQRRKESMANLNLSYASASLSKPNLSTVQDDPTSDSLTQLGDSSPQSKGKQLAQDPAVLSPAIDLTSLSLQSTPIPSVFPLQGPSTGTRIYSANNPFIGLLDFESSTSFRQDTAEEIYNNTAGSVADSISDQAFESAFSSPSLNQPATTFPPMIPDLDGNNGRRSLIFPWDAKAGQTPRTHSSNNSPRITDSEGLTSQSPRIPDPRNSPRISDLNDDLQPHLTPTPRISSLEVDAKKTHIRSTSNTRLSSTPYPSDHAPVTRSNSTASPTRISTSSSERATTTNGLASHSRISSSSLQQRSTTPPRLRPATLLAPERSIPDDPPPPLAEGTFLSVTDPRGISSRFTQVQPNEMTSSESRATTPSRRFESSNPFHSSGTASPVRTKNNKRSFFSTLLHRASGVATSSPSSPGTSMIHHGFRSSHPTGAFSQPATPQPHLSPGLNSERLGNDFNRRMGRSLSESATLRSHGLTDSAALLATPHNLKSIGLKLTPLTPFLPISRSAHPLCGAILDNKYLLIGTNSGLDFVPLPHLIHQTQNDHGGINALGNSFGTVKPMTLIKKTRFRSLRVLEVRSNILLAIAGRNDHLRVYALDGIRAIVAKKMQDLQEREDFVWLPKPSDCDPPTESSSKGKGKAINHIRTNNLPRHSSPVYSPPPAYATDSNNKSHMSKSHSLQPGDFPSVPCVEDQTAASLRRSSTTGSRVPDGNSKWNQNSKLNVLPHNRRSSIHNSSFLSPINRPQKNRLSSPAPTGLQDSSAGQFDSTPAIADPLELGLEREIELEDDTSQSQAPIISTHLTSQDDNIVNRHEGYRSNSSNSTDADRLEQMINGNPDHANAHHLAGRKKAADGTSAESDSQVSGAPSVHNASGSDLIEIIKQRKQKHLIAMAEQRFLSSNSNSRLNTNSRLVARSPLIGDTDEESVDGGTTTEDDRARATQLTLSDILAQPSGGPVVSMRASSTMPVLLTPPLVGNQPSAATRLAVSPSQSRGLPSSRLAESSSSAEVNRNVPQTDMRAHSPRRFASGAVGNNNEMLNMPITPRASGCSSPMALPASQSPSLATSVPRSSHLAVDYEAPGGAGQSTPKTKKRWSVMDSVFRIHNNTTNASGGGGGASSFGSVGRSNEEAHSSVASDYANIDRAGDRPSLPTPNNTLHPSTAYNSHSSESQADTIQVADLPASGHGHQQQDMRALRNRASIQKIRPHTSHSSGDGSYLASSAAGSNMFRGPHDGLSQLGESSNIGLGAPGQNQIIGNSDDSMGPVRERLATNHHGQNLNELNSKNNPHPATSGAPLEYVKLARTKGAKLLRAFETKRRTYLAVLCGESSERIELFTGSKNISLSLNRTFVLPETPRTIEFQMQGDDLVDIYLVYDESVFALEPATVRVREVGISRNERRAARRERERAARDLASTNLRLPVTASGQINGLSTQPEQADSLARAAALCSASPVSAVDEGLTLSIPPNSSSQDVNCTSSAAIGVMSASNIGPSSWGAHDAGAVGSTGVKPVNLWPYTTFQQLQAIPALPASVLASAFVIPPTYEAVVTASGRASNLSSSSGSATQARPITMITRASDSPSSMQIPGTSTPTGEGDSEQGHASSALAAGITTTFANNESDNFGSPPNGDLSSIGLSQQPSNTSAIVEDGPLLSPISLLVNPSSRNIGPPGLFLVSRGKKLTSIVDCDGRSVLKRPFIWTNDKKSKPFGNIPETIPGGFKIDVIVVNDEEQRSSRTILVGIDGVEVKVFEVGGSDVNGCVNSLDEHSNSMTFDVIPEFSGGSGGHSSTTSSPLIGGGNGVGIITSKNVSGGSFGRGSGTGYGYGTSSNVGAAAAAGGVGLGREVVYMGSSQLTNQVIWSERRGNMFGIYCLSPF